MKVFLSPTSAQLTGYFSHTRTDEPNATRYARLLLSQVPRSLFSYEHRSAPLPCKTPKRLVSTRTSTVHLNTIVRTLYILLFLLLFNLISGRPAGYS